MERVSGWRQEFPCTRSNRRDQRGCDHLVMDEWGKVRGWGGECKCIGFSHKQFHSPLVTSTNFNDEEIKVGGRSWYFFFAVCPGRQTDRKYRSTLINVCTARSECVFLLSYVCYTFWQEILKQGFLPEMVSQRICLELFIRRLVMCLLRLEACFFWKKMCLPSRLKIWHRDRVKIRMNGQTARI